MTLLFACILSGISSVGLYIVIRRAVEAWWNRQATLSGQELERLKQHLTETEWRRMYLAQFERKGEG
jgi:hypothetical protein